MGASSSLLSEELLPMGSSAWVGGTAWFRLVCCAGFLDLAVGLPRSGAACGVAALPGGAFPTGTVCFRLEAVGT